MRRRKERLVYRTGPPPVRALEVRQGFVGRLLRLRMQGCLHRSLEEKVVALGIEPLVCVPANIVVLSLGQRLNRPVEVAEAKLVDGGCELLLVIFDERPHLGGGAQ